MHVVGDRLRAAKDQGTGQLPRLTLPPNEPAFRSNRPRLAPEKHLAQERSLAQEQSLA